MKTRLRNICEGKKREVKCRKKTMKSLYLITETLSDTIEKDG